MIRLILTALYLILFFVISLPCYAVLFILRRFNKLAAGRISQRIVCWGLSCVGALSGAKVTVHGLENVPKDEPVLYIANHISFFDIVCTYPLLPGQTGFIAKKEIDKVAPLGWWIHLLNGITMDRKNARDGMRAIMGAIDLVKEGVSIFIFPEGTRSKTGEMADFKAGSFKVATRTKCPIVPVAITGTSDVFENHMPFLRKSDVEITFCKPVDVAKLTRDEIKKIAPTVQGIIKEQFD